MSSNKTLKSRPVVFNNPELVSNGVKLGMLATVGVGKDVDAGGGSVLKIPDAGPRCAARSAIHVCCSSLYLCCSDNKSAICSCYSAICACYTVISSCDGATSFALNSLDYVAGSCCYSATPLSGLFFFCSFSILNFCWRERYWDIKQSGSLQKSFFMGKLNVQWCRHYCKIGKKINFLTEK